MDVNRVSGDIPVTVPTTRFWVQRIQFTFYIHHHIFRSSPLYDGQSWGTWRAR